MSIIQAVAFIALVVFIIYGLWLQFRMRLDIEEKINQSVNTVGQSHCASVFAGDCKALRKEPQRCDESHPQMEPARVKIAQGKFSLGSYRET